MTTVKKILCAIDLTKASRPAFDRALSIARVSKASSTSFTLSRRTCRFHGEPAAGSNC